MEFGRVHAIGVSPVLSNMQLMNGRTAILLVAWFSMALPPIVAEAVEPVPFLEALDQEEAREGLLAAIGDVPPERADQAVLEVDVEESDEDAPRVERVAYESRMMEFPAAGGTLSEEAVDPSVVVEAETVPTPAASAGKSDAVVSEKVVPLAVVDEVMADAVNEQMLIEQEAIEEMPFPASSGSWFNSGFWYASAESLWFDRSRNKRVTVGIDTLDTRLQFTTLAQPFDTSAGVRATLGRSVGRDYLDRDRLVEFTYYGGLNWHGVDGWNSLTPKPTLISPLGIDVPGFNFANTYRTSLNSNFNSIELNYRLRRRLGRDQMVLAPNGGWSRHAERGFLPGLILGVRLANVDEDFWFKSRRNDVDPSVFSGNYDITTQNWLLGMNIGGELTSQNEFFFWGLRGRAAPALSFTSAQQSVVGINTTNIPANPINPSPVVRSSQNSQTSPGFIGDLTLFAGWNVTPNFSLKAGYDFLWIAGIATATRQFDLSGLRQNPMDAGGQTFYNGVSFGLEGSW